MASESIESIGSLPRHSLLALVWTSFSAACLFVILRTAIRFKFAARRRPSGEDYWVWLALAALLTLCILQTIQLSSLYFITAVMKGALPVKEYSKLIPTTENYLRFQFPIVVLFWTVLWCIKAAFLALYFKLFRELTLYRRVWYVLATFTFLAYVGCIITLSLSCGGKIANFFKFAQCGQPEDIWASNVSIYYSTSVDIFTDLCSE
jgi:drug/metabolite transporter (DMT)-like permease